MKSTHEIKMQARKELLQEIMWELFIVASLIVTGVASYVYLSPIFTN